MIDHTQKSNANTFVRAHAYRVFLTSCVGINLGDIPRGLRHPWDVPSVYPSTLGRKTLYELTSLKYCYSITSQSFPSPNNIEISAAAKWLFRSSPPPHLLAVAREETASPATHVTERNVKGSSDLSGFRMRSVTFFFSKCKSQ